MTQHGRPRPGYRIMVFPDAFSDAVGPYFACLDAGRPYIALEVKPLHVSPRGVCHGGVIAALADLQSLPASYLGGVYNRFAATVSFSLDFIAPAPLGEWLELRTELLRATRQFLFTQSVIVGHGERAIARTSGVYKFDPHPLPDAEFVAKLFR